MKYDIFESIGFLATGVREHLAGEYDRRLEPLGLTHKKAGLLWRCASGKHTQISLCDVIQSDKNYVRMYVDELQGRGLLKRRQNPNNRRENLITLTKAGRELACESFELFRSVQSELLSPHLSTEEIEMLHSLLYKAFAGLEGLESTRQKGGKNEKKSSK